MEDKDLEKIVSSVLSDFDVTVGPHDVEACHRLGLSGKNKSKKTIIRLVNCIYPKKAQIDRKKLDSSDNAKYVDDWTKIFISENLSPANNSFACNFRKLKQAKVIDSCYSRDSFL